jgi:hypothetical protein
MRDLTLATRLDTEQRSKKPLIRYLNGRVMSHCLECRCKQCLSTRSDLWMERENANKSVRADDKKASVDSDSDCVSREVHQSGSAVHEG